MKKYTQTAIFWILAQTVAAQIDSINCNGVILIYDNVKDVLVCNTSAETGLILADDVLFGSSFNFYLDTTVCELILFGINFESPAVGDCIALMASIEKYEFLDGEVKKIAGFGHHYSHCWTSPYAMSISDKGFFQLKKSGEIQFNKPIQQLNIEDLKWSLNQLSRSR